MKWRHSAHPISWFRKTYFDGDLVIKPPYQRLPVWGDRQKHKLIETILLGLPIPEIFIQTTTSPAGDSTYAIVDGQQRIRTVLQFIGADKDPKEDSSNNFSLSLLKDTRWEGMTFNELSDSEKTDFFGYTFIVRYLETDSETDVRDMFQRLNESLSALRPQELRNAVYTGPFVKLTQRLAENNYFAENGIVSPAIIRRMGDVEFVSELIIGVLNGPQGGGHKIINDYYLRYEDFEDEFPGQEEATQLYEHTLRTLQVILPEIRGTRWRNKTDFYSLFVALSALLRNSYIPTEEIANARTALERFAEEIGQRITNDNAKVSSEAALYARAVQKGVTDKGRRGDRHISLSAVLDPFFRDLPANIAAF